MRLRVRPEYNGPAVDYIKGQLAKWDISRLTVLDIKKGRSKRSLLAVTGTSRRTYKLRNGVRCEMLNSSVNISVQNPDVVLPHKVRMSSGYGGGWAYEAKCDTLQELIVATAMHELYHFLAADGQLPGYDTRNEREAMRWGWIHLAFYRQAEGVAA